MQLAKRFITVLFSAQLFLTAALCGGACCGDPAAAPEAASHPVEPESAKPSGLCHAKGSLPKPASKTSGHISRSHRACHGTKSATVMDSHRCACSVEREDPGTGIATAAASTIGRDWRQAVAASPAIARWLEDASPPAEISPHALHAHSRPHAGFRLSLRI